MLKHGLQEGMTKRIVIEDFTATAVEAFLHFLYSGVVEAKGHTLIEVAGMADKYNVSKLTELCSQGLETELMPDNACELLRVADRLGATNARQRCLEMVLCKPQLALPYAWKLTLPLLEEVLGSPFLSIGDTELLTILLQWNPGQLAKGIDVAAVIQRHIQLVALSGDDYRKALSHAEGTDSATALQDMWRKCQRGQHTTDVFKTLWQMYEKEFPHPGYNTSWMRPPFLGFWVNLIPNNMCFSKADVSDETKRTYKGDIYTIPRQFNHLGGLQRIASNQGTFVLQKNMDVTWYLPHHAVYLTGVSFSSKLGSSNRIEVSVSLDGNTWSVVMDSKMRTDANETGCAAVTCRSKGCVRWFKLRVREGYFENIFRAHGILQTM